EFGAREQDMTGAINPDRLLVQTWIAFYKPQLGAWSEGFLGQFSDPRQLSKYREYRQKVLELLAKSPIKP
ncbi:MAG: hypothetical protein RMN25_07185, partial [Anaerolineae bacterium]|nr:hypothetical protein [Thermoflexales bacterium]MDW8407552.1 hypothetical protein [Anaerolineae bacterium]